MKALYGDKVRLVAMGQRRTLAQRFGLSGAAAAAGEAAISAALLAAEDKALWTRYGL